MLEHAYLIPLLPFAAAALMSLVGRYVPWQGAWIGLLSAGAGLVQSLGILRAVYADPHLFPLEGTAGRYMEYGWDWFVAGTARLEWGIRLDGMAAMLLVVVMAVSFLVQIYSLGYQKGKPRFGLFFIYLSFFTGSMATLVVANNLFQFFLGWELMGLASYLLIGFEFERPAAAQAGRKAFITTRVGDAGLYAGLLLLFTSLGTLNIGILEAEHTALSPALATGIALLLFLGAVGKSAQAPLHVWLPDAMEGPTPVSALIHAATMVAAGVYLLARFHFIFALSPAAMTVVAWTGGLTALGAALSALTVTDIKRVLAYSTISQLGFMVLAMGVGHPQAGLFHLTTHAFFKALLFLGAGSVIHAVHTNDMTRMGGLAKKMPATAITMAVAWAAIIGFPFTSGFYSKEAVLGAVWGAGHPVLFLMAAGTAFLTTFYMTRLMVLTFWGTPREADRFSHANESGASMLFPLWALAVPALVGGVILQYGFPFERWVPVAPAWVMDGDAAHVRHLIVLGASLLAVGGGLALAFSMYIGGSPDPVRLARRFPRLYRWVSVCYADRLYAGLLDVLIVRPARALARLDDRWIDQGLVDGTGRWTLAWARAHRWVDDHVLDGIFVDGWGWLALRAGRAVRSLQSGAAQHYLLAAALGVLTLLLWAFDALG